MKVQITKEDIELHFCPIAARLRRQLEIPFEVGIDALYLKPPKAPASKILWPNGVREWIQRSDKGLVVEPIEFSIPI